MADDAEEPDLGKHEVLHTSMIISEMFAQYISEHDYVLSKPELLEAAESLSEDLNKFYQLINNV